MVEEGGVEINEDDNDPKIDEPVVLREGFTFGLGLSQEEKTASHEMDEVEAILWLAVMLYGCIEYDAIMRQAESMKEIQVYLHGTRRLRRAVREAKELYGEDPPTRMALD